MVYNRKESTLKDIKQQIEKEKQKAEKQIEQLVLNLFCNGAINES
jgi:hypothetical protein